MLECVDENREDLGKKGSSEKQHANLPLDVLEQVSKHLPPFDYMNFRAVNRIFRSAAPRVNWRTRLSGTGTSFPFPFLMFFDRDQNVYKFVDPRNQSCSNYYLMGVPNSLENHVVIYYSDHGWVLMSELGGFLRIYNPFTGVIINCNGASVNGVIINCNRASAYRLCGGSYFLSKPSGTSTHHSYCIVADDFSFKDRILVSTFKPGDEGWINHVIRRKDNFVMETYASPVLFKDAFYYIDQKGILAELKIDALQGVVSWRVLDEPRTPCKESFHEKYLVECGGELISVFVAREGEWVAVYKLNRGERAWEAVTTLGNYNLYLSPTSSFSVPTNCSDGNKIYFPWVRGSDIVYFSLETSKWHFSGSQDQWSDLHGMSFDHNCWWIKPTWC